MSILLEITFETHTKDRTKLWNCTTDI